MWKRVLLIIGGVLVLAIGIVLVGGALMPRTHVAASTVLIDQPVDSVWAAVSGFENLPRWWSDVQRVERVADTEGGETWTYHMSTGRMTIAVESAEPPRRLVTRIVADDDAPFGGTWTYDLVPAGDGTRVTITEDGYINNLFFRFVANAFIGVHATADSYLGSLARRFAQEIEPEHVR
jgi:uncharacterized protein YndB with AHSA1/START domain